MVAAAEAGTGMPLEELVEATRALGSTEDRKRYEKYGPTTCPQSNYTQKNLNFQIAQISDCVVESDEISSAGLINLVNHCWGAVVTLLNKGIMCRGYITRGSIYHDGMNFMGTGYQEAIAKEPHVTAFKREASERGTPFVEVDKAVCEYVEQHTDPCVKEMFSRFVKVHDGVAALFPFQRLAHSFIIAGLGVTFDPERERKSNGNMRQTILNMIDRVSNLVDPNNPSAVSKANHYIAALETQLEVCAKTDEVITALSTPVQLSRI
jgi:hypothetical protein